MRSENSMKKLSSFVILGVFLGLSLAAVLLYQIRQRGYSHTGGSLGAGIGHAVLNQAFNLLRIRQDRQALELFEQVIDTQPQNSDALWGKAEILRRSRAYDAAQSIIQDILKRDPNHAPAKVSLASVYENKDNLKGALRLVQEVILDLRTTRQDKAIAYVMLGSIYSKLAGNGGFLAKLSYMNKIEPAFLKATELDPGLPEAHLGLGSFYLLAPGLIGGSIIKAVGELEIAAAIAPDFATAHARLAQCYKRMGDTKKYTLHLDRALALDPQNEVLAEIN